MRQIVPIILLSAAAGLSAAEYVNPKFDAAQHPIRKVLLLPAQIQIVKNGIKGAEPMSRESDEAAQSLTAQIVQQLEAAKVTVLPNPFTEEALKQNEALQTALTRLQGKYDTLSRQLHSKPGDVRKSRFTLTDEVSSLGPAADADALIFIRGAGNIPTGGKKAFALAVPGMMTWTQIRTYVALADARTGDIIAIIKLLHLGDFRARPDQVWKRSLTDSFKKLPLR
jgi:hypothetical protein